MNPALNPVLFLDFDGVTHPVAPLPDCWKHFGSLPLIEEVLSRHPGVDIVISSSWRAHFTLDELREHFAPDMRSRVVGCTPLWTPGGACRQGEVQAWLAQNRPGAPWVAIDDDAWCFEMGCPHLLLTAKYFAFQDEDAARLELMLRERLPCL